MSYDLKKDCERKARDINKNLIKAHEQSLKDCVNILPGTIKDCPYCHKIRNCSVNSCNCECHSIKTVGSLGKGITIGEIITDKETPKEELRAIQEK
jgi:hypothetical protein